MCFQDKEEKAKFSLPSNGREKLLLSQKENPKWELKGWHLILHTYYKIGKMNAVIEAICCGCLLEPD